MRSGGQAREPSVTPLKIDALGRVERIELEGRTCVRRVACGGRIPLSRWLARRLIEREARALAALADLPGVPALIASRGERLDAGPVRSVEATTDVQLAGCEGERCLLRAWVDGEPLHRASELSEDFFDHLDALVGALHARGVCHNDLHKEQNVVVARDGYPWLIDFQLASVHSTRGAVFASRVRDDLRHVEKHRRRYTKPGRGRTVELPSRGSGHDLRRSWIARTWRRVGKPCYLFVTRVVLGTRDGEERRESSGPWPRWRGPLGPRPGLPR